MIKKKILTFERLNNYREIINRYSDLDVDSLEIREVKNLIKVVYPSGRIKGVKIEEIPPKQVYGLARGIYQSAIKVGEENKETAKERRVLRNIISLEGIVDENLQNKFIKKINKEIKDFEENHYLNLEYKKVINMIEQLKH